MNEITTTSTTSWLTLAESEIARLKLHPELIEVLRAFGGTDHAPGPASLDPNDVCDGDDDGGGEDGDGDDEDALDLPTLISTSLINEIDADQAQMFARRFAAVSTLLTDQGTDTSSLLKLGLHRRAYQILNVDAPPRALRIRALVDFIWSQALVLGNAESLQHLPNLNQLIQTSLHYKEVAPNMFHGTIQGSSNNGPVHINVLRIKPPSSGADDDVCTTKYTMRTVDARSEGTTNLVQLAQQNSAVAALSGGFFLYSEPDIELPSVRTDPVGLLISDGVVVNPPVFKRGALLQDGKTGEFFIERVGMDGVTMEIGGEGKKDGGPSVAVVVGTDGVRCVHRGDGMVASLKPNEMGISIVGTKVFRISKPENDGVGECSDTDGRTVDVPLAGFVLVVPTGLLLGKEEVPIQEGDAVSYQLPNRLANVTAAMAGGPMLLRPDGPIDNASELLAEDFCNSAPPVTFSQDETFDRNLLPRMGVGLTSEGELVFVAIDGRNLDRALGLTLRGTADLLRTLGCVRALNLDGGSSKRMVVQNEIVCLHSTEIKASSAASASAAQQQEANDGNGNNGGDGEIVEQLAHQKKKEPTPELSRPVHSAILFLPQTS